MEIRRGPGGQAERVEADDSQLHAEVSPYRSRRFFPFIFPLFFPLLFALRKYFRKYLRKYLRSANISVNIFAYISAIKTAIICGAKNTANIYGYIGATLKSPPIFAQIFAVKKAKIYAPQIFAQ